MRLWILPALLLIFGLLSTITLSSIAPSFAGRQLIFFFIGAGIFYAMSKVAFARLLEFRTISYVFACLFLLVPIVFSLTTRNTARWIPVGDWFSIQPSQMALPLVSFSLLWLIAVTKRYSWVFFLKFVGLLLVPAILILIEPDLDTTIVFGVSLASMLLFLPINWKVFAGFGVASLLIIIFSWFFVLQPYQKARLTSFASQTDDLQGGSYNARQALIAVGSGKLMGRGLGQGIQSQLRFLPERQTDFFFSSLAEEYGFLGTSVVVSLYILLVSFLIWASFHLDYRLGQLYLLMVAVLFFIQATININMNIGLLPITGITLPLLSYGGSSIFGLTFTLGIAQSLIKESQKKTVLHIT